MLITALVAAMLMVGLPAHAAATLVVDDDGFATVADCNAATPTPYTTIQSAVTAASAGDTVKVCPGVYGESVLVTKTLTLLGAKAGKDARTRTTSNESTVTPPSGSTGFDLSANAIVLNGFTVRGATDNAGITTRSTAAGYKILNNIVRQNTFGLYANNGGPGQMVVRQNLFADNNQPGSASGNGVYSDQGAVSILFAANNTVDNTNAGFLFADGGTPNTNIIIKGTHSTNDGSFTAFFSGHNVTIRGNHVKGSNGGSQIFVTNTDGVLIENNVLRNSDFSGIAIRDTFAPPTNVDLVSNTIQGADNNGIDVTTSSPGEVAVQSNKSNNNTNDGIFFGPVTAQDTIKGNTALGNGLYDCEDQSSGAGTAGTANFWQNDTGATASPSGICSP